jgi:hypothetical protein
MDRQVVAGDEVAREVLSVASTFIPRSLVGSSTAGGQMKLRSIAHLRCGDGTGRQHLADRAAREACLRSSARSPRTG